MGADLMIPCDGRWAGCSIRLGRPCAVVGFGTLERIGCECLSGQRYEKYETRQTPPSFTTCSCILWWKVGSAHLLSGLVAALHQRVLYEMRLKSYAPGVDMDMGRDRCS